MWSCFGCMYILFFFFFSSRRRHTRFDCDWSSDVCSSDLDFYTAKKPINAVARQGTTAAEIRRSFELRSAIDDVKVRASDLEIRKDGNEMVVGFAYRKEVPLFANVGIYIDFAASTKDQ